MLTRFAGISLATASSVLASSFQFYRKAEVRGNRRIAGGRAHSAAIVRSRVEHMVAGRVCNSHQEIGEEMDKERLVKLCRAGLKPAAGVSKAGLAVFETVYKQVRERPGQDTVPLDSYSSSREIYLHAIPQEQRKASSG